MRLGPESLADAELLAVVLGTGARGASALDAAMAILESFGELRRLAHAGVAELAAVRGVGLVRAGRIQAALALAARLGERPLVRGDPLGTPRSIYERFGPSLSHCETERFVAVPLDRKNRVLRVLTVAQGGVCSVEIIPRDVYAGIVREAAVSVVFLHNHPSGDPSPSAEDCALTERLRQATTSSSARTAISRSLKTKRNLRPGSSVRRLALCSIGRSAWELLPFRSLPREAGRKASTRP
jgi:DNA repair protein RadC